MPNPRSWIIYDPSIEMEIAAKPYFGNVLSFT